MGKGEKRVDVGGDRVREERDVRYEIVEIRGRGEVEEREMR